LNYPATVGDLFQFVILGSGEGRLEIVGAKTRRTSSMRVAIAAFVVLAGGLILSAFLAVAAVILRRSN
jgi:hypothetical protein